MNPGPKSAAVLPRIAVVLHDLVMVAAAWLASSGLKVAAWPSGMGKMVRKPWICSIAGISMSS